MRTAWIIAAAMVSSACGAIPGNAHMEDFSSPAVRAFVQCVERADPAPITACPLPAREINAKGTDGTPLLLWLLVHREISPANMVAIIKRGANPHEFGSLFGATAAGYAIQLLPIAYTEALVTSGLDLDDVEKPGEDRGFHDAMIFSAIMSHDVDKVKLLIDHGANLELRNSLGETPLLFAELNTFDIQLLLLEAGADANAKRPDGSGICTSLDSLSEPPTPEQQRFLDALAARGIDCGR